MDLWFYVIVMFGVKIDSYFDWDGYKMLFD